MACSCILPILKWHSPEQAPGWPSWLDLLLLSVVKEKLQLVQQYDARRVWLNHGYVQCAHKNRWVRSGFLSKENTRWCFRDALEIVHQLSLAGIYSFIRFFWWMAIHDEACWGPCKKCLKEEMARMSWVSSAQLWNENPCENMTSQRDRAGTEREQKRSRYWALGNTSGLSSDVDPNIGHVI